MYRRDLISIFLFVLISVISASEFPSVIKKCKIDDIECQKISLQDIMDKYHDEGLRSLNLIAFDELKIKKLSLPKMEKSPVSIRLDFSDIGLVGISKAKLRKLSGLIEDGPNKFKYELEAILPEIEIKGPYSVEGQVLVLPINGNGISKMTFKNVDAKVKGKCSIVEKDGKKYLHVDKIIMDMKPEGLIMFFDNLFNGNKELADNMNKFLNENWVEVYGELKPVIMEAIGKIFTEILNGVFNKYEFSEIFLQ